MVGDLGFGGISVLEKEEARSLYIALWIKRQSAIATSRLTEDWTLVDLLEIEMDEIQPFTVEPRNVREPAAHYEEWRVWARKNLPGWHDSWVRRIREWWRRWRK